MLIEEKAKEIAQYLKNEEGVDSTKAFDPFLLALIIGVILQIISIFIQKRKSTEKALASCKKPSIMQKWKLRSLLKRELGKKYPDLYSAVIRGSYDIGSKLTVEEMNQMYIEAKP